MSSGQEKAEKTTYTVLPSQQNHRSQPCLMELDLANAKIDASPPGEPPPLTPRSSCWSPPSEGLMPEVLLLLFDDAVPAPRAFKEDRRPAM